MKILQIHLSCKQHSSNDVLYGSQRSTLALCQGLASRGHDVTLIPRAGRALSSAGKLRGLNVVPLPMLGRKYDLFLPLRLSRIIRQQRPDIIATQAQDATHWGSAIGQKLGIPVVATMRSLMDPTPFRRADQVITVSAAVKQHLVEKGIAAERIEVVYNGMDISQFMPTDDLAAVKKQVGIAPDKLTVGVFSRFTKRKGHQWFLQAMAKVCREMPQLLVVLLGEGEKLQQSKEQVQALGIAEQVQFAGFHSDILPWMAAMDIVCMPSISHEGFGRVLVEAGAMEKPLVATPIGGMAEIVLHGETGFIVPAHDDVALIEAMLQLLRDEDLRRSMGKAGRERAMNQFTEEAMVSNTEKVYQKVLAQTTTRA